ncbi:MAG: hypothetical protein JF595_09995 [Sphingomonadales bacterium]|nr:hypothetical protein [Sphingomonadales bacterium]
MRDFGYAARGRALNEAQAKVHATFADVVDRSDEKDSRTRRWLDAIEAFREAHSRVYSRGLQLVEFGALPADEVDTTEILDFLEADPVFFRSGYMKEVLLSTLKQRSLSEVDRERLQAIIIEQVSKSDRREFRRICRVATTVADASFRTRLEIMEQTNDPNISRRASWVLAALTSANGPKQKPG